MSSTIDPAKLKVVELRQELSSRGLDTKGNKAVLVKRLKDALEIELQQDIPDTSIADTSTEDFNASQIEDAEEDAAKSPQKEASPVPESPKNKKIDEPEPEKMETTDEPVEEVKEAVTESVKSEQAEEKEETSEPPCDENGDKADDDSQDEPRNKKSRWGTSSENPEGEDVEVKTEEDSEKKEEKTVSESGTEVRGGEKRKRGSPSPSRTQRRRSKSPVKEDEPVVDNNKVQLSWYDSDLHLQIDKDTLLSARPYHDGAFGYAWAGVRATHGVNSGKVCFEVKITEELKWEDNIKQPERGRRERDRRDSKRERSDRDKKSETDEKKKDKANKKSHKKQSENGDKKEEGGGDVVDKEETEVKEDTETKEDTEAKEDTENKEENVESGETKEEKSEEKEEVATKPDDEKEETDDVNKDVPEDVKEDSENGKQVNVEEAKPEDENKMEIEETKVEEKKEESMDIDEPKPKSESKEKEELPPIPSHLIRIGWSTIRTDLQLGEAKFSYGFESSGKFVVDKQFSEYGKTFGAGDVVGAYVEYNDDSVSLTFTVNGEKLPEAISLPRSELPEDFALYPHVLSRNCAFEVNLGSKEEPWFANPEELADYVFVDKIENKIAGPIRPEKRSDCEVIMMCGLPAAGKTHWVKEYVEQNAEKNYYIIGTMQLLEKMTVNGNPLKNNLRGRWNVLLDRLTKSLTRLVEVASLRRRNFIIDQTNVFPSAQRRKMRSFEGFKRRAVIVVCGEEEQAKRRALQEAQDGKDVPDVAVLEMKANMSLPRVGEWIEEVTYIELNEQDAKAMVQKYNGQGKEAGYGPTMQRRDYRDDRFNKWHGNRRTEFRGNYRDRSYNRFDRGNKYGGGWQNRSVSSWGRNDRRDSRGSQGGGGSRDWRNNNRGGSVQRHQERGRDRDGSRHGSRDSYSRSRNQGGSSSRSQTSNWQGSGSWGQGNWQGNWQAQGGGGSWGGQGGWGQTQGQGKWNYNQSYGQQSYGNYPNWNYYGQYQNWNTQQGQPQQIAGGTAATGGGNAAWAQYAQQYAQSNTGQQSTGQK